jgi:RNA polymerase I-specific transcription initiation factor RRN7
VRDLWALQLQVVVTMLPENLPASQPTSRAPSRAATDNEDGYSSQQSSNYLYAASDSDVASTTYSSRRRRQRVVKARDRPQLVDLLALCYLGLQLLRSPVSLGDFHRWVDSQELTYTRAIRAVPEAMREKLSAEYHVALEPMTRLVPGRLCRTVHEMVVLLHSNFGLAFPPVNREVLLIRAIHDLGLPLEIYAATKRLADRLFMTFEWPPLVIKRRNIHWPEAKLLALVIAAVKLCYGLDGVARTPHSAAEPAATALEWGAWEQFLRGGNTKRGGKLEGTAGRQMLQVDVKEADVFEMNPEELDWYLDWYEKTWCAEGAAEGGRPKCGFLLVFCRWGGYTDIILVVVSQNILNLFPLKGSSNPQSQPDENEEGSALADRLADLHSHTVPVPAVAEENEDDELQRPGEQYLYYSWDEEMPYQLKTLTQAAADFLGINREDMQKVVHHVDKKLREQIVEKRRNDRRAGIVDDGSGDDDE